jgi:hypothetical protein
MKVRSIKARRQSDAVGKNSVKEYEGYDRERERRWSERRTFEVVQRHRDFLLSPFDFHGNIEGKQERSEWLDFNTRAAL